MIQRWIGRGLLGLTLCFGTAASIDAQEVVEINPLFSGRGYPGVGPLAQLKLGPAERNALFRAWSQKKAELVLEKAQAMITANPQDHSGYVVRYLAHLELQKDRPAAHKVITLAAGAMAKKSAQLVKFIELAVFAKPTKEDYRSALMALSPLVPDNTNNAAVRVAHLRALEGCGKIKEAVITNKSIVEDLEKDPKGLLHLATTICHMSNARALAGVARKALEVAEESMPDDLQLLKVKYRVLYDFLGLHKEAKTLGESLVQRYSLGTALNNFVWYMMVETPDEGKYPTLALIGARRMLTATEIKVNEWDTVALAFFRNGFVDKAIEYQEKALSMNPGDRAAYEKRMQMYRAAAAARKKKAGSTETPKKKPGAPETRRGKL